MAEVEIAKTRQLNQRLLGRSVQSDIVSCQAQLAQFGQV